METDVLFEPIRIGSLPVKNRIVMGPMIIMGGRIFAQLMQGYGRGESSRIRGVQSGAASPSGLVLKGGMGIPGFMDDYVGEMPCELELDEIEAIEEEVGVAAARAQRAGFDGVELPCFIGYLAAGFLSPLLNRRTDRCGGSLENRARFIIKNVRQVRRRTGADFPVGVRLTADDHVEGGIRLCQLRSGGASWVSTSASQSAASASRSSAWL
jgi:2,4-dienoyl-CoA reductase-like NADH-dependent reductase (Old Yellow Enzyme family)